jgi:hypothetical protein
MTIEYELTELLDQAVTNLQEGKSSAELAVDPQINAELAPLLFVAETISSSKPIAMPSADELATDRQAFLAELDALSAEAVSPTPLARLTEWTKQSRFAAIWATLSGRGENQMVTLLARAALAVFLFVSAAGVTTVAADNSIPGDTLYPVKLQMEEARLGLTGDSAEKAVLHMRMVAERVAEMEKLAAQGEPIDEAVVNQLQLNLDNALAFAAAAPEAEMSGVLLQIQSMTQSQTNALKQLQTHVAIRDRDRDNIQNAAILTQQANDEAQFGMNQPATFRWRFGHNRPNDAPEPPALLPVPPTIEPPQEPAADDPPGAQNQFGQPEADATQPEITWSRRNAYSPCATDNSCIGDEPALHQHQLKEPPDEPLQVGPGEAGGNPEEPSCNGAGCDAPDAAPQHQQYNNQPEQDAGQSANGNQNGK